MKLYVIGINHKAASVSIREQFALLPEHINCFTHTALKLKGLREIVLLSTCNRTEIYFTAQHELNPKIIQIWAELLDLNPEFITKYTYSYQDQEMIHHLMQVACGLDSLILGEPQILGQLKQAHQYALEIKSTGKYLNHLFQKTFQIAKRVRTETSIGKSAVSVAFTAVNLAKQIFTSLNEQTAMLIGAGETIELVIKHLQSQGMTQFIIANRTLENAHKLAENLNIDATIIGLDEINTHLIKADLLIASTGGNTTLVSKAATKAALKSRRNHPILMIDLAIPRDIAADVDELDNIYVYTIDHLENIIEENQKNRQEAAKEAELIILEGIQEINQWKSTIQTTHSIKTLTQKVNEHKQAQLKKAIKALNKGEDPYLVIEQLAQQLANQIIHPFIIEMRTQASFIPDENEDN